MQGQFLWYDVMTTDVTAASRFYSDVLGWNAQDAGGGGKDYTVFSVNGVGVAGLLAIPEDVARRGVKPAWLGYVAVDDVDAAVARVKQEGGKVHREPETVPGVIRFAVVGDPQGAPFYVARGLLDEAPPEPRPARPERSAGANCSPASGSQPSPSMRRCLAGPKRRASTWARWAPISSLRRAARRSAA